MPVHVRVTPGHAGINVMALYRLVKVHAPVVFGKRLPVPGDRMWRAVEEVKEQKEAELTSLIREEMEEEGLVSRACHAFTVRWPRRMRAPKKRRAVLLRRA